MNIICEWEHNGSDTLLHLREYPGAYTRGKTLEEALHKVPEEVFRYQRWMSAPCPDICKPVIARELSSSLDISDADSDILLEGEGEPLSPEEYLRLKDAVLRSAVDFQTLYDSVPDKHIRIAPERIGFYGLVPATAEQMYQHTKNVNAYYFGEIGIEADNCGSIVDCRTRGFELLEQLPHYLDNCTIEGSFGEYWSLKKLMRRFLWHDRIHGKAMYRRSIVIFGSEAIVDVFSFGSDGTNDNL